MDVLYTRKNSHQRKFHETVVVSCFMLWFLGTTTSDRKGGTKTDHFKKCITPVYNDKGKRSVYQNVP